MSKSKNEEIEFDCSFCNNIWKTSNYKIRIAKTAGGKHWIQLITYCPKCKRQVTVTSQKE